VVVAGNVSGMTIRVDAWEARELLAAGVPVIDVLPASIYGQEHLPGAVNIPLETFEPSQLAPYDNAAPLVVYCFDQH
jgi:rhodanese-related sulfurtransferase